MKTPIKILSLVFLLFTFFANAEQKVVKNDWDIHYIAFPSSFLEPDVAKTYELQRSRYMAIVNISVLDNKNDDKPQNVSIFGTARNLLGQTKPLAFKKVKEGIAVYYLAQVKYRDQETLNFDIKIQRGDRIENIKFKKKLYVD